MGTIIQGRRVLELNEKLTPPTSGENFHKWVEENKAYQEFRPIEEHFFIIAANKAIEWINESSKSNLIDGRELTDFIARTNCVNEVRNMREHILDYYKGTGRRQKNFQSFFEVNGNDTAGISDATATVVTDKGYLLGGRVNIQEIIAVANDIYPIISDKQFKLQIAQPFVPGDSPQAASP